MSGANTRRPKADTTRRPEAEKAYLAGLLELLADDVERCRTAVSNVASADLTIDGGSQLLEAILEASDLNAPSLADVLRIARARDPESGHVVKVLLLELSQA